MFYKDKKKEPAYGTDVLRFWASSVEFWRDAPLGPTVLAQSAEALRKIRNTARFILGNTAGSTDSKDTAPLQIDQMSVVSDYVFSPSKFYN
jgi:isoleucyl-tRNA synthetase